MKMQGLPSSAREAWPDLARAVAIVLVVVFHARHSTWLIGFQNDQLADSVWWHSGFILTPLRMPLFFIVSGMLSASSVGRPWREVSTKRVWNSVWLYSLWALIYTVFIPTWPNLEASKDSASRQIIDYVTGNTPAWYLWALVVYFVIARFTRTIPAAPLLAAALILSAVASELEDYLDNPPQLMLQSLFFFLAGCRFRDLVMQIGRQANVKRTLSFSAVLIFALALHRMDVPFVFPGVGLAAVLFGINVMSVATRHSSIMRQWGGWLGARTLPIYVIHFLVLTGLLNLAAVALPVAWKSMPYVALAAPLVLTILTVALSLILARLLPRLRLGWLLAMPARRFGAPA